MMRARTKMVAERIERMRQIPDKVRKWDGKTDEMGAEWVGKVSRMFNVLAWATAWCRSEREVGRDHRMKLRK